jgi:hypothetical protein
MSLHSNEENGVLGFWVAILQGPPREDEIAHGALVIGRHVVSMPNLAASGDQSGELLAVMGAITNPDEVGVEVDPRRDGIGQPSAR